MPLRWISVGLLVGSMARAGSSLASGTGARPADEDFIGEWKLILKCPDLVGEESLVGDI